jgi:Putative beta barrel porin-7 (BBP7)
MRGWLGILGACFFGGVVLATDPPQPAPIDAPPLPIAATVSLPKPSRPLDIPPLSLPSLKPVGEWSGGQTVSVPLQVVPEISDNFDPRPMPLWQPSRAVPDFWATAEYVTWWPKAPFVPPLVIANRVSMPRLGGPSTATLIDTSSADSHAAGGARFGWGFSINENRTLGVGAGYHFQSASTQQLDIVDGARLLARPILDAVTGLESSLPISDPNSPGYATLALNTRSMGWELYGLMNLIEGPQTRVHLLSGYRYFQLREGLRFTQTSLIQGNVTRWNDEFHTENDFHGGMFGLSADMVQGVFFVEISGKIAIGQVGHRVRVSGERATLSPQTSVPTGLLAQSSNIGITPKNTFGLLPEGMLRIGYRFTNESRIYLGYNVLYLSDTMRPGEQIDRTLNLSGTTNLPTDRPALTYLRSDFWLQGFVFGVEYRY